MPARKSFPTLLSALALGFVPLSAQVQYPAPYVFEPLAGESSVGSSDGVGGAARFFHPQGLATDRLGNLFVADTSNQAIRKIAPDGRVTTVAGLVGFQGGPSPVNGSGKDAQFSDPMGIAADATGNLFVSDFNGYGIRKVTPAGEVSTFVDRFVGFDKIMGLDFDPAGNLLFTDWTRNIVGRISPTGVRSIIAGGEFDYGHLDGPASTARFQSPRSITSDAVGNLFVTEWGGGGLRKITPDGVVSTLSGPTAGALNVPTWGVWVDVAGALFVTTSYVATILRVAPDGTVTTVAGQHEQRAHVDASGGAARFFWPQAITGDGNGNLFVVDDNSIRKITPAGQVTTLAGLAVNQAEGSADGKGAAARFSSSCRVARHPDGSLIVLDVLNLTIRRIAADGTVTTIAGEAGQSGSRDGLGTSARFSSPRAIAVSARGDIYVADRGIRKISWNDPAWVVTTILNETQQAYPEGFAVAADGSIYFTEFNWIRRCTDAGEVSTFASTRPPNLSDAFYVAGSEDGPVQTARFSQPTGLVFDRSGNLFVADTGNNTIRKITPGGMVTTFAGAAQSYGFADDTGSAARFSDPTGLAIDGSDNLYVVDTPNQVVRKITPTGVVTSIAGLHRAQGNAGGVGTGIRLSWVRSIAAAPDGTIYVPNFSMIHKGIPAVGATLTHQPQSQSVEAGSNAQFSVTAHAVPVPTYQWYFNGNPFAGATGSTLSLANTRSSDAGEYSVVVTNALGSVTSAKATLAVTAAPIPPPPAPSGGGGGGAPSWWFLIVLGALRLLHRFRRRRPGRA